MVGYTILGPDGITPRDDSVSKISFRKVVDWNGKTGKRTVRGTQETLRLPRI